MEILEKIKTQIAEFDAKRKDLLASLKNEFAPMVAPLFEKHPKIKSFQWNQYTPYFNDGEECTFSVNIDYPTVNGYNEDDDEEEQSDNSQSKVIYLPITEDNISEHRAFNLSAAGYKWYADKGIGEQGVFKNPNYDQKLIDGIEEFKKLLSSIPEDFLKDLFGDHMQITLLSDGTIETEEYEHD